MCTVVFQYILVFDVPRTQIFALHLGRAPDCFLLNMGGSRSDFSFTFPAKNSALESRGMEAGERPIKKLEFLAFAAGEVFFVLSANKIHKTSYLLFFYIIWNIFLHVGRSYLWSGQHVGQIWILFNYYYYFNFCCEMQNCVLKN